MTPLPEILEATRQSVESRDYATKQTEVQTVGATFHTVENHEDNSQIIANISIQQESKGASIKHSTPKVTDDSKKHEDDKVIKIPEVKQVLDTRNNKMIEIVSLKSNKDYTIKKGSEEGNFMTETYEEYDIMPDTALD